MDDWLKTLESRGDRVARFGALCGIVGLVALALMTIADVLMRWLFNEPIDGVADVGPLIVAITVSATFPFAVAGRYHIRITFLGNLMDRTRAAWLNAFATIVTTGFFILFAWQFILHTINVDARGETTWVLRWPVAPWWAVVTLFLVLCAVLQIIVLFAQLRCATNRGEVKASSATPQAGRADGQG